MFQFIVCDFCSLLAFQAYVCYLVGGGEEGGMFAVDSFGLGERFSCYWLPLADSDASSKMAVSRSSLERLCGGLLWFDGRKLLFLRILFL